MNTFRTVSIRMSAAQVRQIRQYVAAEQERERLQPTSRTALRTGVHLWMSLLADDAEEQLTTPAKVLEFRPRGDGPGAA